MRLSYAGVAAALLHLVLLAGGVIAILSSTQTDWTQYWTIFLALDFPVSVGVVPVTWFVPPSGKPPLSDFSHFWWPLAYHGVVGTAWWYIVGWTIARKIARRMHPHDDETNERGEQP